MVRRDGPCSRSCSLPLAISWVDPRCANIIVLARRASCADSTSMPSMPRAPKSRRDLEMFCDALAVLLAWRNLIVRKYCEPCLVLGSRRLGSFMTGMGCEIRLDHIPADHDHQ